MEFLEFPKMLYKNGDPTQQVTVNSQEEEDALGEDYIDEPIDPATLTVDHITV